MEDKERRGIKITVPKPNIVEAMRTKRLQWAGHAWRNQNPLIRTVLEKNPAGRRPIGRPKMIWEDVVKKDVEELGGGKDWKARAADRERYDILNALKHLNTGHYRLLYSKGSDCRKT